MSTFRILAETLAEKNYFDVKEVEEIIEVYFKIWLSDIRNEELMSDDIMKQRSRLLNEKSQLDYTKSFIERQLLDAKVMIEEGREVDKYWMNRATFAFRVVKRRIVGCQSQLANLTILGKKRNIERTNTHDRNMKIEVFVLVKERFGEDYAKKLFDEAAARLTEKFTEMKHEG